MIVNNYENFKSHAIQTMSDVPDHKNKAYWADHDERWNYHKEVISILEIHGTETDSVLELGTMGNSVCIDSDTMDYDVNLEHMLGLDPTYTWDARRLPWPIPSLQYEWFISLRVFHHLWPVQREAFEQALRVSKNQILVVPHHLENQPATGVAILPDDLRLWNSGIPPKYIIPVGRFGFLYAWIR